MRFEWRSNRAIWRTSCVEIVQYIASDKSTEANEEPTHLDQEQQKDEESGVVELCEIIVPILETDMMSVMSLNRVRRT